MGTLLSCESNQQEQQPMEVYIERLEERIEALLQELEQQQQPQAFTSNTVRADD
tara:strand:+ start:215 stop:376 length:162 start_codon:yes stop_codon:yes gene_type:complete